MSTYSTQDAALRRAAWLAQRHDTPMYVVRDGEDDGYAVASEEDLDTFFLGATVIAEVFSDGSCASADG